MKLRTGVLLLPPPPLPPSLNMHGGFGGEADGDADGIFSFIYVRDLHLQRKLVFPPSRVVKLKSEPGRGPLFWEGRAAFREDGKQGRSG